MRIELKSFRSKVARRIFVLFMLCAILPVSALAVFSFGQVKKQLYEQSRSRLKQEAKSLAVSIYERLDFLRSDIKTWSAVLEIHANDTETADGPPPGRTPSRRFESLIILRHGQRTVLFGESQAVPRLTAGETAHLGSGKTLLRIDDDAARPSALSLFAAVDPKHPELGVLWGRINAAYLWEAADRLPISTELCVLGRTSKLLFSTFIASSALPESIFHRMAGSHIGQFEWRHDEVRYFASYNTVFLEANFFYPELTILVSEPEEHILKPMENFNLTFPVLIVLSLGMVFFLSMNLIRKNLNPIERLRDATQKVARGDLGYQVDIQSNDEFEKLGRSFNEMSVKLADGQQLLIRSAKMATMGQMAAGVIHEIKQPLSGISGNIQLAQMDAPAGELRDRLNIMMHAVERLDAILERFRNFAYTSEAAMRATDLHQVVERGHQAARPPVQTQKSEDIRVPPSRNAAGSG